MVWCLVQSVETSHHETEEVLPLLKEKQNVQFDRMALCLLLSYALLLCNTGSSDGDTVYVKTGDSVQLDIQREKLPAEFEEFNWKKETKDIIVKYTKATKAVQLNPSYKHRVDFNNETFSLKLKDLQKNDSGLYTAVTRTFSESCIAEHRVSIIDAVKAPVLTVNSYRSSTEPCNFTCTADNLTIINYYNSSCSDEVKSSGIYNLSLKCTDDFIICNYSNPVSWKNDTQTLQQLCTFIPEKRTSALGSMLLQWLLPFIFCILLLCLVAGYCYNKKTKDAQLSEDSIYAEVKNPTATEKSNKDNPVSIYSTIQQHPIPPTSESVNKHTAGNDSVQLQ